MPTDKPKPRPIEKVRYNQAFRLPGAETWELLSLVDKGDAPVVRGRPIPVKNTHGRIVARLLWATIVEPLTD